MVPGSIHNLEADLKYSIKKYKSKLDDAQQLIKLTAANMKNDEQKMSGKVGEFLLELVGWYDIQRVFSEYDPITGEKLSAGDRVLAVGFLALTFVPPAKAAGVGGKAAVKGVKAALPSLAKTPEAFMKIRNVLDPKKVQQAFRSVYNEVVKGPIAATKVWFDKVKKGIGDIPILQIRQEALAGVGVVNKTVKDAFGEAKDYIQRIKSSQVDEVDVKGTTKGTSKNTPEIKLTKEQLATKPQYSPVPEKWLKRGGTMKIDEDGTWIYTNKKGQTVSYPDGYPDFSEYAHPSVKPVEIEIASPTNRPLDYKNANIKAGLNKDSHPPVASLYEAPEGYTWHHHQDGKTMILVDKKVHREFTHAGGISIINRK